MAGAKVTRLWAAGRRKEFVALVAAIPSVVIATVAVLTVLRSPDVHVTRIGGANRIETAVAASALFDEPGTVVLAPAAMGDDEDRRAAERPALLQGARLAVALEAPLLLTTPGTLPARVAAVVRAADTVCVVGGPQLVEDVERVAPGVEVRTGPCGQQTDPIGIHGVAPSSAWEALPPEVSDDIELKSVAPPDLTGAVVVTGRRMPDLADLAVGAAAAGRDPDHQMALLVVPEYLERQALHNPDPGEGETPLAAWVMDEGRGVTHAFVIGGSDALSEDVRATLAASLDRARIPRLLTWNPVLGALAIVTVNAVLYFLTFQAVQPAGAGASRPFLPRPLAVGGVLVGTLGALTLFTPAAVPVLERMVRAVGDWLGGRTLRDGVPLLVLALGIAASVLVRSVRRRREHADRRGLMDALQKARAALARAVETQAAPTNTRLLLRTWTVLRGVMQSARLAEHAVTKGRTVVGQLTLAADDSEMPLPEVIRRCRAALEFAGRHGADPAAVAVVERELDAHG